MSRNTLESILKEGRDSKASDAQESMEWLEGEADGGRMSFVSLFHNVTESTLILITRDQARKELLKKKVREAQDRKEGSNTRRSRKRKNSKKNLEKEVTLTRKEMETLVGDLVANEDLSLYMRCRGKKVCNPEKRLLSKLEELLDLGETLDDIEQQLTIGDKVLLGVAWCREDERELFEKFPTLFMFDVTADTNREGRPLGVVGAVDGNMDVFTPLRVIMPSEKGWVFDWIFRSCIPKLLGTQALLRTGVVLTDGDPTMYRQFDANQAQYYPNARHVLCMYHLVTKGIEKLNCRLLGTDR